MKVEQGPGVPGSGSASPPASWRQLLCSIGFHDQEILKIVDWGNCLHAKIECRRCRKLRFALIAGKFEYLSAWLIANDEFWTLFEAGKLPDAKVVK